MPELPEVETLARELKRPLAGKTIKRAVVLNRKTVAPLKPRQWQSRLRRQKILTLERRAKMLVFSLSSDLKLLVHLKMTGQLIYRPPRGRLLVGGHPQKGGVENLPNRYTRAWFEFTDRSILYFNDLRKFGWLRLMTEVEANRLLGIAGVEPLAKEFTPKKFNELLKRYPNRRIKQLLLDQALIAGIGNIYADESCFLAAIRPTRRIKTLSVSERIKLHQAIIAVLKHAIRKKGTSARNYVRSDGRPGGFVPYLNVYGRAGATCRRCGGTIKKIKLAGRGTHFCPKCQK